MHEDCDCPACRRGKWALTWDTIGWAASVEQAVNMHGELANVMAQRIQQLTTALANQGVEIKKLQKLLKRKEKANG